ncbi:DUF397 domain-containing protein [Streptomyces actinomycinicus]|uniref:DUF397 domain-containing protein n=1 Tax=Streptomyces actinomycinicus TaxID=1695166 RepID=A0A937JNA0_9ACTN|nr:DUF397 domain-containing protein [Streptomyces actinomycinicus]MBL1083141.1 DUF397 domain-containing protein [Streptomyces actinomycinicus]
MRIHQPLTNARWRKSSYSGNTGGDCVECTALGPAAWRKSSYSGSNGGECIEVADLPALVAVRDSKNPDAAHLAVAPQTWAAFVGALK